MVQQIIKYSDGTETIINYNSLKMEEEKVEVVEEAVEETVETPEVIVEATEEVAPEVAE